MANLVKRIKSCIPSECLATRRLRKVGCSVSLATAPTPWIAIDMDKPQAPVGLSDTKCDYIFIGGSDEVLVMPMELTKQDLKASKFVKQLRAGAQIAARILPSGEFVQFQPVGVCGGKIHRAERDLLLKSSSKIQFKGKHFNIRLLKCGQPLINALSNGK